MKRHLYLVESRIPRLPYSLPENQSKTKSLFLGLTGSIATRVFPNLLNEGFRHGYTDIILHPTKGAIPFFIETLLRRYGDILDNIHLLERGKVCEKILQNTNDNTQEILGSYLSAIKDRISPIAIASSKRMELSAITRAYESGDESTGIQGLDKGGIKHIDIARRIDTALIAPATANTIAKIVNGTTDNFLLEVVRAIKHDGSVPVYIAPAMNTEMLHDPFTESNLRALQDHGKPKYNLLPTQVKTLQCGEYGDGGLLDAKALFSQIQSTS